MHSNRINRLVMVLVMLLASFSLIGGTESEPSPKIKQVQVGKGRGNSSASIISLDQDLLLTLEHEFPGDPKQTDPNKQQAFTLVIDSHELPDLPGELIPENHKIIRFHLSKTDKNREVWARILGGRWAWRNRQVSISVLCDKVKVASLDNAANLGIADDWKVWLLSIFTFGLILGLGYLASTTSLLRDSGGPRTDGKFGTFSLARVQMAFWFTLIVLAFLYIWIGTMGIDSLNATALGLLGIASSGALGAAVVESNKDSQQNAEIAKTAIPAPVLATTNQQAIVGVQTVPPEVHASEGILADLFQDAQGYSLARVQLFVWTLVMAIIFVTSVYNNLAIPTFDATLLGLMGISNGVYLGFKIPEVPHVK